MFDQALKKIISEISTEYGMEPAVLLAVVEVESAGKMGVMVKRRFEPLIRFEGHYFYRLLPAAKRNVAVVRKLASAIAGRVKNPFTQDGRWRLLRAAMAIDRPAALASVSWGAGQVMGAHWRWLGYASIDALVSEARDGAAGQIRLMMRFIDKAGLIEKLNRHDWRGFARAYNGPAFRKNKYDQKMARAYRKHLAASGRAGPPPKRKARRNALAMLAMGSTGAAVKQLQKDLAGLGFGIRADGDFGPATQRAVKHFQSENRLKADGIAGPKTFEMLRRKLPPAG